MQIEWFLCMFKTIMRKEDQMVQNGNNRMEQKHQGGWLGGVQTEVEGFRSQSEE